MDAAFLDLCRRSVGRRPAGLEAAALINRDIDHHRARSHPSHESAADELGRRRTRDQNSADYEIGGNHFALEFSIVE
jgi:hypothetical protein